MFLHTIRLRKPTPLHQVVKLLTCCLSEVRRAVLLNVPINSTTYPHILARTRDTDTILRKFVYSHVLESNVLIEENDIGTTYPRALTIAQRELIIRNGLGDREPTVRKAAASLLGRWVDVLTEKGVKPEGENINHEVKIESGLVALLGMLDLTESAVAADAILSIFVTRVDIFENMEFGSMCLHPFRGILLTPWSR